MLKIIADHRERKSGIIRELVKHKVEVEEQQLIAADFIIQTKDNNDQIKNIGIERKTQEDFINSIIEKRINQQLMVLKENFDMPLLIIEGSHNLYTIRNFHPNSIRGMLSSIAIDYQIPIIYTRNYRDTALLLIVMAKRMEKPYTMITLLKKRKPLTLKEQQQLLIETLPGVGPSLSKSLLKEFKNVKSIINASEEDLQRAEKIGPKKAREIFKVINSDY
ncbi:MAG: ERCC4 domain-containing protein [Candidatus Woesearchaeota archaeon]